MHQPETLGDLLPRSTNVDAPGATLKATPPERIPMSEQDADVFGSTSTIRKVDVPWDVILWNDPVTLISLVVRVIRKVFGYSKEKAETLTMTVHHEGKAVVWSGDKETAAAYCVALHGYALGATIQPGK